MKRLTKYSNDIIRNKAINIIRKLSEKNGLNGDELAIVSAFCLIERIENKALKEYEDLEEQGKLLKLPCAVGDTVYADSGVFGILEYEVDNIVVGKTITYQCSAYSEEVGDCPSECLDEIEPDVSDFGKTVFLTREKAEAALKEL